jgi:hypothetical protein
MKRIYIVITALCAITIAAFAQTATPAALTPTYVGAGAAFNQIGNPRVNLWATAIYPVASSIGMYSSTTTDIVPVARVDAATGRKYFAFTTSIRQGVHKVVYTSSKFTALLGGDGGVGLSQAAPSGVDVSLSAAFTATLIYQLSPRWAIAAPIRGIYSGGAWNLVPEFGFVFKPGK